VRHAEIQARLTGIERALKAGHSRALLWALLPELSSNAGGDTSKRTSSMNLQEQLLRLLHQEQALLVDYGPNHPQVQSVRKHIDLIRRHFARPVEVMGDILKEPGKASDALLLDPMEIYVQSLKQELQDIQLSEQLLAERFQDQYEEARKLTNDEIQDERFRDDIRNTHQLYETIVKRLQDVNLARDYGGYDARTISPAGDGFRVEPNAAAIFTAAMLLGSLGGFVLAYLADRTDKSFRTAEEIRRRLGLPIVGHIPLIKPAEEALADTDPDYAPDPLLWTYYRPQSQEAEAYRGVRTALYFSMRGKDHRVIQITSPDMGDGKTTLVANLGVSIAQSGKKVLLIDADFRRPRLHQVFAIPAPQGLTSIIQGDAEPKDVIQPAQVSGLAVLPCGQVPPNPAELLMAPRFQELLDTFRAQYDFVLIDTPPLLAVTDPCVVAPCVDAVLLNIRVSKNGRPNAERAKEILSTLGVTVLGVVVNGVDGRAQAAGYSYGYKSYHYGDGYGPSNGHASRNGRDSSNGDAVAQGKTDSGILGANGVSASLSPIVPAPEAAADGEGQKRAVISVARKTRGPDGRAHLSRSRPSFLRRFFGLR
jgi:capsular exopolysaccharide synthesis family protein